MEAMNRRQSLGLSRHVVSNSDSSFVGSLLGAKVAGEDKKS
jgi:hypothetical protein